MKYALGKSFVKKSHKAMDNGHCPYGGEGGGAQPHSIAFKGDLNTTKLITKRNKLALKGPI